MAQAKTCAYSHSAIVDIDVAHRIYHILRRLLMGIVDSFLDHGYWTYVLYRYISLCALLSRTTAYSSYISIRSPLLFERSFLLSKRTRSDQAQDAARNGRLLSCEQQ